MDQLREYRFTIPGVFSSAVVLLGLWRAGYLVEHTTSIGPFLGILAAVVVSFAIGYPFSLVADLFSHKLEPNIPEPFSQICEKHGILMSNEARFLSLAQILVLDEQVVNLVTRRLNNFYVAFNSITAIVGSFALFGLFSGKWPYRCPELCAGVILVFGLVFHAKKQWDEYNLFIRILNPLVISRFRKKWKEEVNGSL